MRKWQGIVSALCILASSLSLAQTPSDKKDNVNLDDMSLEDLLNIKVSVASKSDESIAEASSSVTVFTQAEIRKMGIRNLEQILNFVPGFWATRNSSQFTTSRIGVRGTSAPMNEVILFLLNGQRLNDVYSGGAVLLNRNIAVENVSRIEVIRGPGSALYGSNAFMGVVNIITEKDANDGVVRAGENEYYFGSTNFSKPLDNGGRVYGHVSAHDDQGQEFTTTGTLGGAMADTHTTRDPQSGKDILVGAEVKNFTMDLRHMDRLYTKGLIVGYFADDINNESISQDSATLKYKMDISEKFSAEVTAGFKKENWYMLTRPVPYAISSGFGAEPMMSGVELTMETGSAALDFRYTPPIENNEVVAGLSYEHPEMTNTKSLNNYETFPVTPTPDHDIVAFPGSTSFIPEKGREIFGVYVQDTHKFSGGLKAVLGVRYDDYSDFGSTTNPRLALVMKSPWTSGSFKAMYGEAFRAPSFIQLYSVPGPNVVGNPDLKAEKVKTTELAYAHTWAKGEASLTFFQNDVTDKLEIDTALKFQNTGSVSPRGFEIGTKFGVGNNTTVNAQYTQVFSDVSPATPKSTAGVILNYGRDKWNYNLATVYTAGYDYTPGNAIVTTTETDASTIFDASVMYKLSQGLELQASVMNLTDEETDSESVSNGGKIQYLQPNRGREVFAQLRYDF